MAFPTNPTNGQTANVNGVTYTYSSTLTAWQVTTTWSDSVTVASVSATGNINAAYLLGNGSGLTGLPASYSNSSVATFLASYGSNTISTTGNITLGNGTVSTSLAVGGTTPSGTAGEIRATNAITSYYSDSRLKNKVGDIEKALDKIDQLTGFLYTENDLAVSLGFNNPDVQVALSAQDVQRIQPEAVKPAPFDIAADGTSKSGENYLTVQYDRLIPLLVEGIKELRREVNHLKDTYGDNSW